MSFNKNIRVRGEWARIERSPRGHVFAHLGDFTAYHDWHDNWPPRSSIPAMEFEKKMDELEAAAIADVRKFSRTKAFQNKGLPERQK